MEEALDILKQAKRIVFMTGAGVSVPSGIPDYRSMLGVYQGIENPEYLLSHTCLKREPEKFYDFVKELYHEDAQPNVIHKKMAVLEEDKDITIITQNIDDLHMKAGSTKVIPFHGSLYDCYCQKCQQPVSAKEYTVSMYHNQCGGIIRPDVVLYEEGLDEGNIYKSIKALEAAEVVCIVGTSFQVYPFSGLIQYRNPNSQIIVVNKDAIKLSEQHTLVDKAAEIFFNQL